MYSKCFSNCLTFPIITFYYYNTGNFEQKDKVHNICNKCWWNDKIYPIGINALEHWLTVLKHSKLGILKI